MAQGDEILGALIDANAVTSTAKIRDAADSLTADDLARLAELEQAGGNRKTVLAAINELRAAAQAPAEQAEEEPAAAPESEAAATDAEAEPVPTEQPEDAAEPAPAEQVEEEPAAADEQPAQQELASAAGEEPRPVQPEKPAKQARGEELPKWLTDPDYTGPLTIDRVEARRKWHAEHK